MPAGKIPSAIVVCGRATHLGLVKRERRMLSRKEKQDVVQLLPSVTHSAPTIIRAVDAMQCRYGEPKETPQTRQQITFFLGELSMRKRRSCSSHGPWRLRMSPSANAAMKKTTPKNARQENVKMVRPACQGKDRVCKLVSIDAYVRK